MNLFHKKAKKKIYKIFLIGIFFPFFSFAFLFSTSACKSKNIYVEDGYSLSSIHGYVYEDVNWQSDLPRHIFSSDDFRVSDFSKLSFKAKELPSGLTLSPHSTSDGLISITGFTNTTVNTDDIEIDVSYNHSSLSIKLGCVIMHSQKLPTNCLNIDENHNLIGFNDFFNIEDLKYYSEITIPADVVAISENAFKDKILSGNELSINFAEGSQCQTIADNAFENCTDLRYVYFPNSLISIGNECFKGCSQLEEAYFTNCRSLSQIGNNSFENCGFLSKAEFSGCPSLTSIPSQCFKNCSRLKYIDLSGCSSMTTICDESFINCEEMKYLILPANLQRIMERSFSECAALIWISIPNTLQTLEQQAFYNCKLIKNIRFDNWTASDLPLIDSWNNAAFSEVASSGYVSTNNQTTEATNILNKMNTQYNSIFSNWTLFHSSVKIIDGYSSLNISGKVGEEIVWESNLPQFIKFDDGSNINDFTKLTFTPRKLPANLNLVYDPNTKLIKITGICFNPCDLSNVSILVTYEDLLPVLTQNFKCEISFGETLPKSFFNIENDQLKGFNSEFKLTYLSHYKKMVIPKEIKKISANAFYGKITSSFAEINLEFEQNSLCEEIGENAFAECSGIIGKIDLSNCPSLTKIDRRSFALCSDVDEIVFPSSLEEIGQYAFDSCVDLKISNFPQHLTSIGDGAFRECSTLMNIDLSSCINLNVIPSHCFEYCDKIESITLPSNISTIYEYAFYHCSRLRDISAQNSNLTAIYDYAFANCSSIQTLDLSVFPNLQTVAKCAFESCTKIISITLVDTIKNLGDYAFSKCSSLQTINFYNWTYSGINKINEWGFTSPNIFIGIPEFGSISSNQPAGTVYAGVEKIRETLEFNFPIFDKWIAIDI